MEKTMIKAYYQLKEKSTNVRIGEWLWSLNPELFKTFLTELAFHPPIMKERPLFLEWRLKAKESWLPVASIDRLIKIYRWSHDHSESKSRKSVLLVHGWAGRSLQLNAFIQPLLEQGYDVISFDAPAHGESTGFSTNFFEFVESVKAVVDNQKDVEAVVAHSMGSGAVLANLPYYNFISKVVLIAPHFDMDHEIRKWALNSGLTSLMFEELKSHLEMKYQKSLADCNPKNLLDLIDSDVLLIHDMDDQPTSYHNSLKLKEKLPKAEIMLTQKLGHYRIIKTDEIVKKAVDFIK